MFALSLSIYASVAVIRSDAVGNRTLNKARSYSKIDALVALSMALGSMSVDDVFGSISLWGDPKFKLAV